MESGVIFINPEYSTSTPYFFRSLQISILSIRFFLFTYFSPFIDTGITRYGYIFIKGCIPFICRLYNRTTDDGKSLNINTILFHFN